MAQGRANTWTLSQRLDFQELLSQGYSLSKIKSIWLDEKGNSLSVASLSKEVSLGLTEEEYKNKQFVKYDVVRVYENLIGEDAVEYLQENRKR